jgi:hypothetical protein
MKESSTMKETKGKKFIKVVLKDSRKEKLQAGVKQNC